MKSRTVTIRFYPDREADRTALHWLDCRECAGFKSNNALVVTAINDYFTRRERQKEEQAQEDAFLQKVLETIREGLRESGIASLGGLAAVLQNPATLPIGGNGTANPVDEESLNLAFDFVDSL